MAAATDLLMEVGTPGTATTLSSPGYTIGNTSITVGSTANWPTATGVCFAIDRAEVVNGEEVRIEGTYCEFVGTVNSGTQITNVSKVYGTDQDYAAGSLTRVYVPVSSERENRLVEWGLVHANQDGTLKNNAVTTASITSGAVNGTKLDSANDDFASFVPSGNSDTSSATFADWGAGTDTLSVPTWATKARVQVNINNISVVTNAVSADMKVVIGSDSGRTVRMDGTTTSGTQTYDKSWADEITLTGTGSQTLKTQAMRTAGTGVLRVGTSSDFTFLIRYLP